MEGRWVSGSMSPIAPGIERGVAEVNERLGRPTILVNNAGLPWTERVLSIDVADWKSSST